MMKCWFCFSLTFHRSCEEESMAAAGLRGLWCRVMAWLGNRLLPARAWVTRTTRRWRKRLLERSRSKWPQHSWLPAKWRKKKKEEEKMNERTSCGMTRTIVFGGARNCCGLEARVALTPPVAWFIQTDTKPLFLYERKRLNVCECRSICHSPYLVSFFFPFLLKENLLFSFTFQVGQELAEIGKKARCRRQRAKITKTGWLFVSRDSRRLPFTRYTH